LTRISPFWIHVFYKKYIQGLIDAGKPGHDPFPTVFDKIVSRNGIYDFCEHNNLKIKGEYVYEPQYSKYHFLEILINLLLKMIHFASIGMLSKTNGDLLYFIEKS